MSGFDVVLGNPPWERVKLQEQEFFATRDSEIAEAPNAAARKKAIRRLEDSNPALLEEFQDAVRRSEGESQLLRGSGRFPLCGRGDINTYAVFSEASRDAVSASGQVGIIVPTGIATDDTTKHFFADLIETETLRALLDFENQGIFAEVHNSYKFCIFVVSGPDFESPADITFCFFAHSVADVRSPGMCFSMAADDIILLNPNTRTCPVFRTERDAEITKGIYRRVPVLIREAQDGSREENPWGITFMSMFHMANASHLFAAPEEACPAIDRQQATDLNEPPPYLPLYEAKMLHQFDHRWATYAREGADWLDVPIRTKRRPGRREEPDARLATDEEKQDPTFFVAPRYWVRREDVEDRLVKQRLNRETGEMEVIWKWDREWLLGWRDIARNTDERTLITTTLQRTGAGHTAPLMFPEGQGARAIACLVACLNSLVVDFSARQKVGGTHLTYGFLKQFPILPPSAFLAICAWSTCIRLVIWITPRLVELAYTTAELLSFARDCGYDGPPFVFDVARRAHIRAELDAGFFHLYGIEREDVEWIMDSFQVLKTREEKAHDGEFVMKTRILDIYDQLAKAIEAGVPYQTELDPPPGPPTNPDGTFAPLPQWNPGEQQPADWPSHIHPPRGVDASRR